MAVAQAWKATSFMPNIRTAYLGRAPFQHTSVTFTLCKFHEHSSIDTLAPYVYMPELMHAAALCTACLYAPRQKLVVKPRMHTLFHSAAWLYVSVWPFMTLAQATTCS